MSVAAFKPSLEKDIYAEILAWSEHTLQKPNPYFARGVLKSKDIIRRAKELGVNVVFQNVVPMYRGGGK